MTASALPPDPRVGRQRVLATYLRVALVVALVLGLAAALLPDDWGEEVAGLAMVVVLIATPIGRLVWLLVRWLRREDRRFAFAAFALLAVMGVALAIA
jgi:Kef-type K+ transport system membrane component KefB